MLLQFEGTAVYSDILLLSSLTAAKGFVNVLQVCERSLNNTQNGPSMPPAPSFVRAEILPSGYLIRPCEGGGSIVHIVDHMDLEVHSLAFNTEM